MSKRTTIHCDECNIAKTELNHWFSIWTYFNSQFQREVIQVTSGVIMEDDPGMKHACGITHANLISCRLIAELNLKVNVTV